MDTPGAFRKYASDCETMAKVSKDPETEAVWKRLAENEDLSLRRQLEERRSKPHRNPHAWEGAA